MHWLSPFFYKEAKFVSLEKKKDKKRLTSKEMKIFKKKTAGYTLFDHENN